MLTLTPAAAEQIRRATEASEAQALALRVAALRDADGTLQYGMGFDEVVDSDETLEVEGIAMAIAPSSVPLLQGTVIDFVEYEPGDFRFIFIPPAAASAPPAARAACGSGCGCANAGDSPEAPSIPEAPVRFFR